MVVDSMAGLAQARLRSLVVVAQRHGGMPRVHARRRGRLEQVELVAVPLQPAAEVGDLLGRGHAREAEQLVERDAGVQVLGPDLEAHVLDHAREASAALTSAGARTARSAAG